MGKTIWYNNEKYEVDNNGDVWLGYSKVGSVDSYRNVWVGNTKIGKIEGNALWIGHKKEIEKEGKDLWQDGKNVGEIKDKDEGCFLTTACVESKGLPDDCIELTRLRAFRDIYLMNSIQGIEAVKNYYKMAPGIVQQINKNEQSQEIYNELYQELVLGSLSLINKGKKSKAFNHYEKYVIDMEGKFCTASKLHVVKKVLNRKQDEFSILN